MSAFHAKVTAYVREHERVANSKHYIISIEKGECAATPILTIVRHNHSFIRKESDLFLTPYHSSFLDNGPLCSNLTLPHIKSLQSCLVEISDLSHLPVTGVSEGAPLRQSVIHRFKHWGIYKLNNQGCQTQHRVNQQLMHLDVHKDRFQGASDHPDIGLIRWQTLRTDQNLKPNMADDLIRNLTKEPPINQAKKLLANLPGELAANLAEQLVPKNQETNIDIGF